MKNKWKRKFESYAEAKAYLKERGELQYFGRAGSNYEYCVYTLTLESGKKYGLFVHDNGLVDVYAEMN